ncbi:MAG TPA: MBOAT family O-acyltransferase [Candidatus Paceibacterota bacterium]
MSFVDIRFLVFFPLVLIANFLTPARFRWIVLLAASYFFYMSWKPEYGLILLAITVLDFVSALMIGKSDSHAKRKAWLMVSLVGNIGLLFVFKYFNFIFDSISSVFHAFGSDTSLPLLNLLLPIGISFHVFQSISYTIDVYMRRVEPVNHFGKFALYVAFFPQLVAGPIERPKTLLPQFFEDRRFNPELARRGAHLMAWGFFKKLVIADNLAPLVNAAFATPADFPGPTLALAAALFAYQIYCDFSGYTDIARGAANILGYELVLNFNRPYASGSVGEFWKRWHISLSSWFRDYVYIPLGGNRGSASRTRSNLLATFLLSGLWHGANWTYVIWGGINGVYLVIENALAKRGITIGKSLFSVPLTFILICVTWVFFRAETVSGAVSILARIPTGIPEFLSSLTSIDAMRHVLAMDYGLQALLIGVLGIIFMETVDFFRSRGIVHARLSTASAPARYALYVAFAIALVCAGSFGGAHQFIYFQF